MGQKVSEVIIEQLHNFGVKHIYGYAGDTILKFFSKLKGSPVKLFTTKHESTAGFMASAEAKLTGNLGVCIAHSGPGTTNIINGIADAYSDRVPLLLITGQVPTYNIGTDYKQYVDQLKLTEPLTVYSSILINPATVIDIFYKAMTMSILKGGVSHIVIPMDLWDQETNAIPRPYPEHLNHKQTVDENQLDRAATSINNTEKISILYGRGAKNCRQELIELAQKINAPLINTLPVSGLIEFGHPLRLGCLGHAGSNEAARALNEADLILTVGATWWPKDYTPRKPRLIQLDLIKENIGATHPVDIGLIGDIKNTLQTLLSKINSKNETGWLDHIKDLRNNWMDRITKESHQENWPLPPQTIIRIISENTQPDEIICLDSGDNVIWFGRYFGNKCAHTLISGTWRTMGFSLPSALAARINKPNNQVTSIIGDGGLSMVLAEISTAVRYNLPIKIIVLNNNSLAMEKNRMEAAGLVPEEVELTNPDFVKIAKACGFEGKRANNINELQALLKENKQTNGLLIDIPTASYPPSGTKLS
ncbi:thiamine pyrophosphate-binding protein [Halothermothrix orenii]|uniref:Pyruvate oxidase n=1 Tax=Halothermothrix orenii (strain H 168 / OCM 544 / DSM 9562) TaxID=373903 RepID=B8CWB0_HALOH|nr:thiamine pyrophosphate-binding protein [Halothermothrix orenii]ACL69579.1 pyruvate oxidase [Halothermothrix orenii H 168]